ncbi:MULTISPECIES: hypothetical protein [unclassified Bradyrhizobium]|uniref:hypothetical protein n=1 Tax=unclassified Bradyrhizobium TaxID=2631580 RepID=UPI0028EFBA83|nr:MULTISPECIES: hypothetical protein [unclassified Bradyrhizobium]
MTELEKAEHFLEVLKSAQAAAPQPALQLLNGLIGMAKSAGGDQEFEIDEARSSAFMSICEVGKALHRGLPTSPLWDHALAATERWVSLVR